MSDLVVHGDVADELQRISERENRPVDDVLRSLIERYMSELNSAPDSMSSSTSPDTQEHKHWGREVLALLDQRAEITWEPPDTDDPVEWVKEQRRRQAKHRGTNWSDE